jgi:hypothetical protein
LVREISPLGGTNTVSIRDKLKSRRVQKIEQPPAPKPSVFEQVGGWGPAGDPGELPNEGDQRRAGAAALADAVRPEPPVYVTQTVKG